MPGDASNRLMNVARDYRSTTWRKVNTPSANSAQSTLEHLANVKCSDLFRSGAIILVSSTRYWAIWHAGGNGSFERRVQGIGAVMELYHGPE